MTNPDMKKAREWASRIKSEFVLPTRFNEKTLDAARVIQSLPDQWIDAEKVREIYDRYRANETTLHEAFRAAVALTTPPLPTLADMTPEERPACKLMQCSVAGSDSRYAIRAFDLGGKVLLLRDDFLVVKSSNDLVTPLPDLPRLEWPAQEPQLEYRPNYGPITLGPPTPEEEAEVRKQFEEPTLADLISPEDVPAGEVWLVKHLDYTGQWAGTRNETIGSPMWSLAHTETTRTRFAHDHEITLVSLLVPEAKP